ncbi:MAG: ORF6N domain-containing protein [Cyclobacteriaceae bacterium]|nr:ORF6N domain-containing protein [Cyclobacteriaceae bacterium]
MELVTTQIIESKIFTIRGAQVMLDRDLAEMYQVETRVLNQAVKRNSNRFPEKFRFQLTDKEIEGLKSQMVNSNARSQIVTLNSSGNKQGQNIKYLPYAFTEQGVAMLSAVLRSDKAVIVSIQIMNAFVEMRKYLSHNAGLLQRVESIESKLQLNDQHFEKIFTALEQGKPEIKQDIFFKGQIFDAYSFVVDLIKKAKTQLIIIDNYIDLSILEMLTEKSKNVRLKIITQKNTPIKALDIEKFNAQYGKLEIQHSQDFHDRFLIIDQKELYHIGASLKDLGKKCFAFSLIEDKTVLNNLIEKV